MKRKLEEISRITLYPKNSPDGDYTNEQVQTSALIRIANATELISKNYVELLREIEREKARADRNLTLLQSSKDLNAELRLSIKAYKSHITRLKNKIAKLEETEVIEIDSMHESAVQMIVRTEDE